MHACAHADAAQTFEAKQGHAEAAKRQLLARVQTSFRPRDARPGASKVQICEEPGSRDQNAGPAK